LAPLTTARIIGITVPAQVGAGDTFDAIIRTENYIQTVEDVSIVFGIAPSEYAYPGELGTELLTQKTLGPELSNTVSNITAKITLPASTPQGSSILAAALYSLYGARYGPTITNYNVTVVVANTT
ncbi:hypothetical protein K490DRAFT_21974, partial [Saccharata proteae CBS 121410]